jgi:hypothetical protein
MPALTPAQEQVISLLATGTTLSAAAETAGVHRNTIANWRHTTPAFAHALAAAQYDRILHWRDLAEEHASLAIATIRDLMADPNTPASIRLKAALALLKECTTLPPAVPANDNFRRHVANLAASAAFVPEGMPDPEPLYTPAESEIVHNSAQSPEPRAHETLTTFRRTSPKTGRNDLCPCGSGQKHKRCCLQAMAA